MKPDEVFLTTPMIAKIFSVKPETIRTWIRLGKLKGVRINGHWRVAQSEVTRYAEELYG